MIQERTYRILLAVVCCFALVLIPMTAGAQGVIEGTKQGIKKGAHAVGEGAQYGVDKTKEGAEAVGKGVKKTFTDDDSDNDRQKSSEGKEVAPSQGTTSQETTGAQNNENRTAKTGGKGLPRTAGELPLLALLGTLSLAGAAASRLSRRKHDRSRT